MHGIEVTREESTEGGPRAAGVRIQRISVCYEGDRKMTFIPEAGGEFFTTDDVGRLVGVLHKASETLEWKQIFEGSPDAEQGGGSA
jgi:hypothetical protein